MKKLSILSIIIFVLVQTAFSQDDLKKEIMSFSDSTEVMIRNGRRLILEKTLSGEYNAAIEMLDFLKNNSDTRYVILYPGEEMLFSMATRNFQLLLYNIRNYGKTLEGKTKHVADRSIAGELNEYLDFEMPLIMKDLENEKISEYDKEVIKMYLQYYNAEDLPELNKSIKKYLKTYPESEYSNFLKDVKRATVTGRMNFVLGYGNEFLNGKISDVFTSRNHILNMEMDGFINQFYISLFFAGSVSPVRSSIDLPVQKTDFIHSKDDKAGSTKYGMKFGYSAFSNNNTIIYPYLSIGGYNMNSHASELKNNNSTSSKTTLTSSFFTGAGAATDILLKKWSSKSIYEPGGLLFIRSQIGYDRLISGKNYSSGSNFYFTISLGLSLGAM